MPATTDRATWPEQLKAAAQTVIRVIYQVVYSAPREKEPSPKKEASPD